MLKKQQIMQVWLVTLKSPVDMRKHLKILMHYSYGNERLTNERFTGWTGYYTYDPRGSVTGVTGSDGYIWQSYRYNAFGDITFGKLQ